MPKNNLDEVQPYENLISQIPIRKRMSVLTQFVTGMNLDHIYSLLDKLETISRGGYRIILGEKPVQRKVHYTVDISKSTGHVLCSTGAGYKIKLKTSTEYKDVTCKRCLALLKQKTKEMEKLSESNI